MAVVTGLARRMVTVPGIIIVTVVLAAIAVMLVPVSFPAPDHGPASRAPGADGSLGSLLSWRGPRGWSGGGHGVPGTPVLAGNAAAVPWTGQLPEHAAPGPVREAV